MSIMTLGVSQNPSDGCYTGFTNPLDGYGGEDSEVTFLYATCHSSPPLSVGGDLIYYSYEAGHSFLCM